MSTTTTTSQEAAMTTTHTLSPVTFHEATEDGALDGWRISCSCGERAGFSIKAMTERHGRDHLAYFARKEAQG